MTPTFASELETSRRKLLAALEGSSDVTFIRLYGNIGDELIYAGARQLLAVAPCREISFRNLSQYRGDTAVVAGSGGWCRTYHEVPSHLKEIERRFERVIIFPSSFEIAEPAVQSALAETQAIVFAREPNSYSQIKDVCNAQLALDTAFFFKFESHRALANGKLTAFRTDREASSRRVPVGNNDISITCESLDEWLWAIARSTEVFTDRAHVMIAAAMLGKKVQFRPSNYHKLSSIAEYALSEFDVQRIGDDGLDFGDSQSRSNSSLHPSFGATESSSEIWDQEVRQTVSEIFEIVPDGSTFILIDDEHLGLAEIGDRIAIPFLERGGKYWGPPTDSDAAMREFERLHEGDAEFLILTWPAFWWLDCYREFNEYLRERFKCLVRNERLVVYALESSKA